ncbi:MAG: GldG family protein [Oligoflexia bacterium]|nr:GldG family protein [Oligoflexia bacterium]
MQNKKNAETVSILLWSAAGALTLGMLFARAVYPELTWLSITIAIALVLTLGALIQRNRQAFRTRTAAFGLSSFVTAILVIAIIGVLNFLSYRYPLKKDLTQNQLHTLSDQTVKLVKGLTKPVKATVFVKAPQREQSRELLDNYKALSTQFEVEFVDPDREPTRTRQLGIRKLNTVHLTVGARDTKIEEPTEEKLTNALIKLLKDRSPTLCTVTGHGEKSFGSTEAEGYDAVKKALGQQAYEVKDFSLLQDLKDGKVPESCDALAIVGPTKSFFPAEIKALSEYLAGGGRALIALDVNLKGGDHAPELFPVLEAWQVKPGWAVIVDPYARLSGVDAAVPLVNFSREHAITKDFQVTMPGAFPFARPIDIAPGAPAGLKVEWIGQTSPKSWGVTDAKELASGQVTFRPGRDRQGPLNVAVAIDGKTKDSKAARNTRMVVFGSSFFATNNFSRMGGNLDLFLNAASWLMEDESLISIRAKEEGPGKVELTQKSGAAIFLATVVVIPLLVAVAGIVIWVRRRKL